MARILLDIPMSEVLSVRDALFAREPSLEVRSSDQDVPDGWADCLLTWAPTDVRLLQLAPGGFVQAYGAGVDRILSQPSLPPETPIARLVDRRMSLGMTHFVVLSVLRFLRNDAAYRAQQTHRVWRRLPHPDPDQWPIGVLGMGALGTQVVASLESLGLRVQGWRRRDSGTRKLSEFLGASRILISLLPLTAETRSLLDREAFSQMPKQSYLISCGRGEVIVEQDLLSALRADQLAGAALDVFEQEPLAPEHPFWTMPSVTVTPHIATFPMADAVAEQAIENIKRLLANAPLNNLVDRSAGY